MSSSSIASISYSLSVLCIWSLPNIETTCSRIQIPGMGWAFLIIQLNLFLTCISVRPSTCIEISCHFEPILSQRFRIWKSSCRVHLPRFTLGSIVLIHLSRHCLGVRWLFGPTRRLNSSAILVHSFGWWDSVPFGFYLLISLDTWRKISVSSPVHADFLPPFCWMNNHLF